MRCVLIVETFVDGIDVHVGSVVDQAVQLPTGDVRDLLRRQLRSPCHQLEARARGRTEMRDVRTYLKCAVIGHVACDYVHVFEARGDGLQVC